MLPSNPWPPPASNNAHALLIAEQEMRAMVERYLRDYRQLVVELATRYGQAELDKLPRAPISYGPAEWRAFFAALPMPTGPVASPGDSIPRAEHQQVQQQLASARQALRQAQNELGQLRATKKKAGHPPASVKKQPAPAPAQTPAPVKTSAPTPPPAPVAPPPPTLPPCRWPILPPKLPMHLGVRPEWQTLALEQLWLITQGYPLFSEGRHWLTQRHPTERSQIGEMAAELERANLIQVVRFPNILPQDGTEQTISVTAATLTPTGTALCQALGWRITNSEMAALGEAGLDERQVAGGLLLAASARQRGYAVSVGVNRYLWADQAWVCLALEDAPPTDLAAWHAAFKNQGFVALCAATPARRALQVAAAQAQGWPGRATDLQTLRTCFAAPLWPTRWTAQSRTGGNRHTAS